MRCEEYLQLLSTLPVEELVDGRAGDHLGTCPDCNRATKVVVERERNMVMVLAGMSSHVQPMDTARTTFALARHRSRSRWYIGGLLLLLLAFGSIVVGRTVIPIHANGDRVTATLRPQCLSPTAAADLLRQQESSGLMRIVIHPGSTLLTVSGSATDLVRARAVLARYDNPTASTCVLPQPGSPKPP